jgi:hypothetical protein
MYEFGSRYLSVKGNLTFCGTLFENYQFREKLTLVQGTRQNVPLEAQRKK